MPEAAGEVVIRELVENLRAVPYETHKFAVRYGTRIGPLEFIRRKRSPPIRSQRVTGPDGQGYVLTWERFWDDRPNGAIRVIVEVQSEATLQTWSEDFIVAPDSSSVGD